MKGCEVNCTSAFRLRFLSEMGEKAEKGAVKENIILSSGVSVNWEFEEGGFRGRNSLGDASISVRIF